MNRRFFILLGVILFLLSMVGGFSSTYFFKYFYHLFFFTLILLVIEYYAHPLGLGGKFSVKGAFYLAAIFLFPLAQVLVLSVAVTLTNFFIQKKEDFSQALLELSQKIITLFFTAGFYAFLGGEPMVRTGGKLFKLVPQEILLILGVLIIYSFLDYLLQQLVVSFGLKAPILPSLKGALRYQSLYAFYLSSLPQGIALSIVFKSYQDSFFEGVFFSLPFLFVLGLLQNASYKKFEAKEDYFSLLLAGAKAAEKGSLKWEGHAERVAGLAKIVGLEMGLYGEKLDLLVVAATLHDIGKIYIDEDAAEYLQAGGEKEKIIHPRHSGEILRTDPYLKQVAAAVEKHHLPYEGRKRSLEKKLPLESRIISCTSDYDEFTQVLPAEERLTPRVALARIKREQGLTYDPKVVRALERVFQKKGEIK